MSPTKAYFASPEMFWLVFVAERKTVHRTGLSESVIALWITHDSQNLDWKSNALTHQLCLISSKIHKKLKVSSHWKSGNIAPMRRYTYFLFRASLQSRSDPNIVPETFTWRFGPRCHNDHICFLSSIHFKPIYISAVIVYDFNLLMCQFSHYLCLS